MFTYELAQHYWPHVAPDVAAHFVAKLRCPALA